MKSIVGESMSRSKKGMIKAQILRKLDDGSFKLKAYDVPYVEGMSVLNVLNYIYENIDSKLTYFVSCRIGLCGRCDVILNGEAVQACNTIVTGDITVDSMRVLGFKPIKDLVAGDIFLSERDKLFLAHRKAFYRFKTAYDSLDAKNEAPKQ